MGGRAKPSAGAHRLIDWPSFWNNRQRRVVHSPHETASGFSLISVTVRLAATPSIDDPLRTTCLLEPALILGRRWVKEQATRSWPRSKPATRQPSSRSSSATTGRCLG